MEDNKLLAIKQHFRTRYEMGFQFGQFENYNEETFHKLLEETKIVLGLNLNAEEIKQIKKVVDSEFQIFQPDGIALLDDYEHARDWYTNIKDEVKQNYWNRYRQHLFNKGWETTILNQLEFKTLDSLMNYLGNPHSEDKFSRKGLVMGDVQSGKTSNYIGLICKAADAGYKVIILLTGLLESLRKQTQIRVEEGFIGWDVENKKPVGVGRSEGILIPRSGTSRGNDFTGNVGENTFLSFSGENAPFIFITKKNPNTLKKIRETITNINITPPSTHINTSVLIIDDEADNASINTNDSKYDPTKINSEIRKLLNLFTRSNYVGFTATPFANVFIDPDSETEMLKGDLFPRDFIYSLNPPNNYFGANKIFLEKKYNTVHEILDSNESFPLKHNKDWSGSSLFGSLVEAMNSFLLINAIRDINEKNQKNSHRTMLINVSRFINVQERIEDLVNNKLSNILNAIKYNYKQPLLEALKNSYIKDLKITFDKHYSTYLSFEEILETIYDSTKDIKVFKVPNKIKEPDYDKHQEQGLRCIVVGGLALSRGLTLEGLTISYLYRNTSTFDVLMQMGRWFGYRNKPVDYAHLCKVWMLPQTKEYFEEIATSINQLKLDIEDLSLSKQPPKEFGIRVRNESDKLGITDRNKMRSTKKYVHTDDLFGKVLETPFISGKLDALKNNMKVIENILKNKDVIEFDNNLFVESIETKEIVDFLEKIDIHEANRITYFEKDKISKFITEYGFTNFDLIIIGIRKGFTINIDNHKINLSERKFDILENDTIRISGVHRRVGGRQDTRLPNQENIKDGTNSSYLYEGRNPVLLLYPLELKKAEDREEQVSINESHSINKMVNFVFENNVVPYGIGIGFPRNTKYEGSGRKVYYINDRTKWWNIMNIKDNEEDE